MQPSGFDISALGREAPREQGSSMGQPNAPNTVSRTTYDTRRLRSDESWVELSSQPSSSSLSSVATDEIVTTGLRVQRESRRRRRLDRSGPSHLSFQACQDGNVSSQEDYGSDSESDKVMASSNEAMQPNAGVPGMSPPHHQPYSSASEDASSDEEADDDDENATALGVVKNEPLFTPQPNAFSHPPAMQSNGRSQSSQAVPGSYFPQQPSTSRQVPLHRQVSAPLASRRPNELSPSNTSAPLYAADHDAALRASLSTLLSCAAAARGLPKSQSQTSPSGPSNRIEPTPLRMVPESMVMDEEESAQPAPMGRRAPARQPMSRDRTHQTSEEKPKRKASGSRDRRAIKKTRNARMVSTEEMISPTLLTWVVSAGVVVLVSAISFSAGYAMGREVGRIEAGTPGGDGVACGREAVKGGFRRIRWGSGARSWIGGGPGSIIV